MTGKRVFTARPSDAERWVKAPEPKDRADARAFTARLTIDVTPALRGRIKIAAFAHGLTVADILRALPAGAPHQTLPFVRPGAEILLTAEGWPKVEQLFRLIDAIAARGVPPAAVAPDHWHHMHHRLLAGGEPRPYTLLRHRAWLKRRNILP